MTRIKEIDERLLQISNEVDMDGADLSALETEVRTLKEERAIIQAENKKTIREAVAKGAGTVIAKVPEFKKEERIYDAASKEYKNAYLKNLLDMDMSSEERAAFVHMTTNTQAVLPTMMINEIWNLVSQEHAIMGDITIYRTGTIIEVMKHTAIAQGKAKTVAENTANEDEQNTFVKVTLSGKDFSKHIDVSYALGKMSVDSLEQYLVNEIAKGLAEAMAMDVIVQIGTDMAAANKIQTATKDVVVWKDIANIFAKLKRVRGITVYMQRSFLYKHLVGLTDNSGKMLFQPNAQNGAEGTLLGAIIKIEDAVDENKMLIGDPKRVVYNMVQDVMIETDKDIKKHVQTFSGYARGEGALIDPDSFAELSIKTGA